MSQTICVYGLWHLGCVTAACLTSAGFRVIGLDPDPDTVQALSQGTPPVAEPGLAELIAAGLASGRLTFTHDSAQALAQANVLWLTFDTPVDADDRADSDWVRQQLEAVRRWISPDTLVLVSSQVPVGFTSALIHDWRDLAPGVSIACSPENLRLGQAIDAFRTPGRVIVGVDESVDRERIAHLFAPFCEHLEWMRPESAEMTKHALNGFLAVSVIFTNELARLCERTGADAREVERGLRSDPRVGQRAYVSAGPPIAGGTLARDVRFLGKLGREHTVAVPVIDALLGSNAIHDEWAHQHILELIKDVVSPRVTLLGLTYKPGTDTLRRSTAVELGERLAREGITVAAFDPAIRVLPPEVTGIQLRMTLEESLAGADVALIATPWPAFRDISAAQFTSSMRRPQVVDPAGVLAHLAEVEGLTYVRVGAAPRALTSY